MCFSGAYHSAATLSSLPAISKRTGVTIKGYSFSETQNGKSNADRIAALVKNKARRWVDTDHDANTHDKFYEALTNGRTLKATSIYLVRPDKQKVSKNKMPKISEYYDFVYGPDSVRYWHHMGIGDGRVIKYSTFVDDGNEGKLIVEQKGGRFAGRDTTATQEKQKIANGEDPVFWAASRKRLDEETEEEIFTLEEGDSEGEKQKEHTVDPNAKIFFCPDDTCTASFLLYVDYLNHVELGKHMCYPEKVTFRDHSLGTFQDGIEERNKQRSIPEVADAVGSLTGSVNKDAPELVCGWALMKRAPSVRYAEKAKQFLEMLYDEGIRTGHKDTPETAEDKMRKARDDNGNKMFLPAEVMTTAQIKSYFSRITSDREKAGAREKRANAPELEGEAELMPEFDEEGCNGKAYDDYIREAIAAHVEEWFIMTEMDKDEVEGSEPVPQPRDELF